MRAGVDGAILARTAALLLSMMLVVACRGMANDPRADAPGHVDVVTLNLWHDRGDWPTRRAMIEDELRRLAPDVILLQEVLQDTALPNQAQTLAQRLGYYWHFVSVDAPGRTRRYGNAILTREPMTHRGERALQPKGDYRIAGWARTTAGGHALDVYVVHLNFTDRSGATRARQLEDLMGFIADTRGHGALVVGGDFNTVANAAELAPMRMRFVDAYAAAHGDTDVEQPGHATLNERYNPPARIDRVYVWPDAFCRPQARRILDRPDAGGAWASDHFGVWARLPWRTGERCDQPLPATHGDEPRR